jgi:hypothetical protein
LGDGAHWFLGRGDSLVGVGFNRLGRGDGSGVVGRIGRLAGVLFLVTAIGAVCYAVSQTALDSFTRLLF